MDSPFIGSIVLFAGNFAPRGWALCQGQLLPISQNAALFSILGTTYGGNGQSTFALPNLQGRVPLGNGNGQGLSPRVLGEVIGTEQVSLITSQMPAHNHLIGVSSTAATVPAGSGNFIGSANGDFSGDGVTVNVFGPATPNATLNPATVNVAGSSLPHDNMQPSLCLNYIIALEGIFPTRN